MDKSSEENLKNASQSSLKKNSGDSARQPEPRSNIKQSLSEILEALNALSAEEWDRRVELVIQSAMREPEKYAFFLGGRRHPLADVFEKVWDSVKLIASIDTSSPIKGSKPEIIMGALASKKFDVLERMGLSIQSARQQFNKKTLFCIDTVASTFG